MKWNNFAFSVPYCQLLPSQKLGIGYVLNHFNGCTYSHLLTYISNMFLPSLCDVLSVQRYACRKKLNISHLCHSICKPAPCASSLNSPNNLIAIGCYSLFLQVMCFYVNFYKLEQMQCMTRPVFKMSIPKFSK